MPYALYSLLSATNALPLAPCALLSALRRKADDFSDFSRLLS